MKVIPAIDILGGKVVRLLRGDPNHCTIYNDSPLETANRWQELGAELIHVVDLDAALGRGDNFLLIEKIIKQTKAKIQVGGGLRSLDKIEKFLEIGAQRVVIGTKALEEEFLEEAIARFGERIAIGVDELNHNIAIEGWQTTTAINFFEFIEFLRDKGVKWIIYTDVLRDGSLEGPNIPVIQQLAEIKGVNYLVSGGVSCLNDLLILKEKASFVWGVIVGRALYEGKLDFPQANSILSS